MTGAHRPAPPTTRPAGAAPVGARAAPATPVDLEEVTRRVYQLLLEDLQLELARSTGRR
ncbi:hypothetical protein Ddep01_01881 [Deinococcus depolymerans]|uniref:hypothetical protein n=1 Tax=Deinococcus depolymerans TaxID=392408 RepID=UPI0030A1DE61